MANLSNIDAPAVRAEYVGGAAREARRGPARRARQVRRRHALAERAAAPALIAVAAVLPRLLIVFFHIFHYFIL